MDKQQEQKEQLRKEFEKFIDEQGIAIETCNGGGILQRENSVLDFFWKRIEAQQELLKAAEEVIKADGKFISLLDGGSVPLSVAEELNTQAGQCSNLRKAYKTLKQNQSILSPPKEKEACSNCKETQEECACIRNKCMRCGKPVGNITFTICDDCWGEK